MQYEFYRNYWAVSSSDLHVLLYDVYDGLETTTRARLDNKVSQPIMIIFMS
jgi:hypothetical protein